MEKQFTFKTNQVTYGNNIVYSEQEFDNLFGKWKILINYYSASFGGYVIFEPAYKMPECLLENLKITLNFICNPHSQFTINNVPSTFIPNKSCFVFNVNANGVQSGYSAYQIEVKVDASQVPLPSEYKELCSAPTSAEYSEKMFEDGKLADVIIKTKDENEIKAHNFFLSRSQVFDTMLNKHDTKEAQHGVIEIEDIDHDVLVEMIRYLYSDKIPKIEEMALQLLIAGNKYDIPGLVDECGSYLAENVSIKSFAEVLIAADQLNIQFLKDAAINYVVKNRKIVFPSEVWKKLKVSHMLLAMEVMESFHLNN